jgi:hypothetical protein
MQIVDLFTTRELSKPDFSPYNAITAVGHPSRSKVLLWCTICTHVIFGHWPETDTCQFTAGRHPCVLHRPKLMNADRVLERRCAASVDA